MTTRGAPHQLLARRLSVTVVVMPVPVPMTLTVASSAIEAIIVPSLQGSEHNDGNILAALLAGPVAMSMTVPMAMPVPMTATPKGFAGPGFAGPMRLAAVGAVLLLQLELMTVAAEAPIVEAEGTVHAAADPERPTQAKTRGVVAASGTRN